MGDCGGAMLEFVLAKLLDRRAQRRLAFAERFTLPGVVGIDDLLDRDRAGHRRALTHQRGRRAEREAGGMPERSQQRGSDAPRDDEVLERGEMALLLFSHCAYRRGRTATAEHSELTVIDAGAAMIEGQRGAGGKQQRAQSDDNLKCPVAPAQEGDAAGKDGGVVGPALVEAKFAWGESTDVLEEQRAADNSGARHQDEGEETTR